MSKYGENYKKILDGYNKILACIESSDSIEQLESVSNLTENWVGLIDHYSDEIYDDRSNKTRKKDTERFCESGVRMFEDIKSVYQQKLQILAPCDYEGGFGPVRIKNIYEM